MTISMSEQAWDEWEEESFPQIQYPDREDRCDLIVPQPPWLAQGYVREITLRDGLMVRIDRYQVCDRLEDSSSEQERSVEFHCHLSGDHQDAWTEVGNLEYALYGSGIATKQMMTCSGQYPILEVAIDIDPDVLMTFAGDGGALPLELQHLIAASTQPAYTRVGRLSPMMQRVLWQIIRCPYSGMMKRMFLESKALEIAMLMLEEERDIQQGRRSLTNLSPDDLDRIHHAREILLQNLEQPPSLMELARRVGLNDNALKRGFKQVFGKPAFGYLHDYRLEQARQLLMAGDLKVYEVMQQVGFRNRKYFAEAFRYKFGMNPRDYLHPQI
jgi:AraC-like DNA-binding protein